MSLFITFEGGEGCGKSLQSEILYKKLQKQSVSAVLIREPGGTPLGEKVRNILKHACEISISPLSELLLFNASRSQLVSDVIKPALSDGKVVICDRFADSTVAYQSGGRDLDLKTVRAVNGIGSHGLVPDLTFLLDLDPRIGISRKNPDANDRFEKENLDFHNKVRQKFLELSRDERERWCVIDSTLPIESIADIIWNKVKGLLVK